MKDKDIPVSDIDSFLEKAPMPAKLKKQPATLPICVGVKWEGEGEGDLAVRVPEIVNANCKYFTCYENNITIFNPKDGLFFNSWQLSISKSTIEPAFLVLYKGSKLAATRMKQAAKLVNLLGYWRGDLTYETANTAYSSKPAPYARECYELWKYLRYREQGDTKVSKSKLPVLYRDLSKMLSGKKL